MTTSQLLLLPDTMDGIMAKIGTPNFSTLLASALRPKGILYLDDSIPGHQNRTITDTEFGKNLEAKYRDHGILAYNYSDGAFADLANNSNSQATGSTQADGYYLTLYLLWNTDQLGEWKKQAALNRVVYNQASFISLVADDTGFRIGQEYRFQGMVLSNMHAFNYSTDHPDKLISAASVRASNAELTIHLRNGDAGTYKLGAIAA